jgi:tetratricopeptide (TPR) repeat protein
MEKPPFELAIEQAPPQAAPADTSYAPPGETAERRQAKRVFEAKEMDVNPRKPFYLTLGALGLFALGTVGYFWYQLQPRSMFRQPPASAQPASPLPAAVSAAPVTARESPAAATLTPPVGNQPTATTTDGPSAGAARAPAPAIAPPSPRNLVNARQRAPAAAAVTAAPAPQRPVARENDIRITPARVQSDPVLEGAYQAYNTGDLASARADYQQVLRYNPDSRDALLGLAAVETQAGHYDAADRYYAHLLELDPRDAYAQAGLIGLRGQVDPLAAESRLKTMIAAQPDAGFLQFALGNQYAAQGRWAEAQQAYFQAYASDPGHPDFAYNLAISLDRMHQTKLALEYYRRALALAEKHPGSFDKGRVSNRVSQLER